MRVKLNHLAWYRGKNNINITLPETNSFNQLKKWMLGSRSFPFGITYFQGRIVSSQKGKTQPVDEKTLWWILKVLLESSYLQRHFWVKNVSRFSMLGYWTCFFKTNCGQSASSHIHDTHKKRMFHEYLKILSECVCVLPELYVPATRIWCLNRWQQVLGQLYLQFIVKYIMKDSIGSDSTC